MERTIPGHVPLPRTRKWLEVLHGLWGETWVPRVELADRVDRVAERRVDLDREQVRVLDFSGTNARALVTGAAGTGKSVVARELCLRRARSGARVLYLCFTEALARAVDASFAPERPALALCAITVRRHARERLAAAGQPTGDDTEFWKMASLRAACDAIPAQRPDLVVADEAQDQDRMHIALTRATVAVIIVCTPEALAADPTLQPFAGELSPV